MQNILSRLPKPASESTKLHIIRRNLLPEYQRTLALTNVVDISQLVKICPTLEDADERASRFKPPPTNTSSLLEPGLAYKKVGQRHSVLYTATCDANINLVTSNTRNTICWNFRLPGHLAKGCKKPPRRHCFRCGAESVTVRTCEKCSGNVQNRY